MNIYKEALSAFLQEIEYKDAKVLISKLETYLAALYEGNAIVNMVSRKMPVEWYWTHHFLDSLLLMKAVDLSEKTVLDFGTGGGLPGLPLLLAMPSMKLKLLDATGRKIDALRQILVRLGLDPKMAVCARLEDFAIGTKAASFDAIVCRAVALEPRYRQPIKDILAPGGKIYLYKAQKIEDIALLPYHTEVEMEHELLGYRRIMSIKRKDIK